MSQDDRLLSSYKPILAIINISGIHFPLKNRQKYTTTSTLILAAYILAILKAQETTSNVRLLLPKHIRIEQYDRFLLYNSICIVLHVLVFYYRKSARIFEILNKLRDFDENFDGNKLVFCDAQLFGCLAFFTAAVLLSLIRIYVFYSIHQQLYLHTITYAFVSYLRYHMILHYIFFLLQLFYRFRLLNNQLASFYETNPVLTRRFLRSVKIFHEHLLGVAREVDGVFGVYLAHAIVVSCLEQIMDGLFLFFLLKEGNFGWGFVDVYVDFVFKLCFHNFIAFGFAHKVESESNRTEGLVLLLQINSKFAHQLVGEIRIFCIYARDNKLLFSAAGLFNVTWKRLGVFWLETTSYLLFLIQVQSTTTQNKET